MNQQARVFNYTRQEKLASDEHSNLLDPFVTYKENNVLWIRPQDSCIHIRGLYYKTLRP